ncbi:MAG: hypothetical protein ACJ73N_09700 [Bryobacteraceae bacterium]
MTALIVNASLADIAHTLAGLISLAPLFLVPGYLLNRTTQILAGRDENAVDTMSASLVLSIGICPVILYLLGKLSILNTRAFFWACALGFLLLVWRKRADLRRALARRSVRFCTGLALLWLVIAVFIQIDWQWKDRIYPSGIMYDDALRIGLIGGIARAHSLPPPDPFLRLGTAIPLGYHYFWFLLCSLVSREAPSWVGPRGALMAGTIWTALALWAALSLWLRKTQSEPRRVSVRWAVAALVLSISGLDLVIIGSNIIRRLVVGKPHWIPAPSLDWWSFDQVTNWADILLWVPHCAGALAACAAGLLILTDTAKQEPKRDVIHATVAGICFASSVGMSIYVTFGFAVFFTVYFVFLCARKNWAGVGQIAGAGVVAVLLALPYLRETRANTSGQQFFYLALRKPGKIIWLLTSHASRWVKAIFYGPEMALTLFLEFGFFLLALFYWWRMRPPRMSTEHRWVLMLLLLTPLFATSILRSDAVGSNDIAMRGIFPTQLALAVMAGEWLLNEAFAPRLRPAFGTVVKRLPVPALVLLTAGLVTTAAELILLRTFTMFQQSDRADNTFIESRDVGLLAADARAAYGWLQQHSDPNTVVQQNPSVHWDFLFGLYANRQSVVNGKVTLLFNRWYSPQVRQAIQDLSVLFDGGTTAPSNPDSVCAQWGINYLVVKSEDPVWAERNSWVWSIPAVYQNPMARIYSCSGGGTAPSAGLMPVRR